MEYSFLHRAEWMAKPEVEAFSVHSLRFDCAAQQTFGSAQRDGE